jgi:NADPH-dependent curcumin reductase CurA
MADRVNRKVVLRHRPDGLPKLSDFGVDEEPVADPAPGLVVVEVEHLSIDPFLRAALNEGSAHPAVPIGGLLPALGVGRVTASAVPELKVGDPVFGTTLAQTFATLPPMMIEKADLSNVPLTAYLGTLGGTGGLTSYFGIRDVGAVQAGETVVISAAAGAVGSIAGQIARIDGARVIGIAGGPEKVRYVVDELGFDACIDYKGENLDARLRELAPDGIDVFFDNVGGEILDVALDNIRTGARVVLCGAISQFNHMEQVVGPSLYLRLAERNSRMAGFTVTHYLARFPEARAQLRSWLASGELRLREHVEEGIENLGATLLKLFDGSHTGKLLLKVSK